MPENSPGQIGASIQKKEVPMPRIARIACSAFVVALSAFADVSFAREAVQFSGNEPPGTIVVRTTERRLYLVTGGGRALRYTVGVGRAGKQWYGTTSIVRKQIRPAWSPPAEIRGGRPAWVIPAGAPNNPMGAAALVLADNELAIHGTNNPGSIGGFVSWGCIRMRNSDIMDIFERVSVGTRVVLMR
jgi:lipoprotein-anchoring transpeptidase ErfK/SrfK